MKTIIFLFAVLISSLTYAQSANDVLKRIQNKFNSINNFTAAFAQNYFDSQGKDVAKTSGKFSYKKKNKFIVELKSQYIVSDGQTIWNMDSRFNRVVISELVDDPTSFSLERFIFEYPPLCNSKLIKDEAKSAKEELLELVPKNQKLQFKSAKIWVNADGMISKMEVIDAGDMRYAFQLEDVKFNQDLPDTKFNYNPSKGTKVIDLR